MKTLKEVLDLRVKQAHEMALLKSRGNHNTNVYSTWIKASYIMNQTSIVVCFNSTLKYIVGCADIAKGYLGDEHMEVFPKAFYHLILILGMNRMTQDVHDTIDFMKEHVVGKELTIDTSNVEKSKVDVDNMFLYAKGLGETLVNTQEATTIELTIGQLIMALMHIELRLEIGCDKVDIKV